MGILETFIVTFFGCGLFLNVAFLIPQIVKTWRTKKVEGLSLLTFTGFFLKHLFSVFYGVLREDVILVVGYGLSMIASFTLTFLIVYYRYYYNKKEAPIWKLAANS